MTDLEIINHIKHVMAEHTTTIQWVAGAVGGTFMFMFGWLFKLISDNKAKTEALTQQMERNCQFVHDEINAHKLHVANYYTKDSRIEKMIEAANKPINDRLEMLQQTLNLLVSKQRKDDN